MTLKNEVKKIVEDKNAIVGFASINRFNNVNKENHPKYYLNSCETVIVIGTSVPKEVYYADNYALHFIQRSNHVVFNILDKLTYKIVTYLEKNNHNSIPIPSFAPMKIIKHFPNGLISLKNAAIQAGLGNTGKNDIVYNKKYGGLIRFAAILTNVKIEPDALQIESICDENCRVCIDACPAHAITKKGYNNKKCFNYTFDHGLKPMLLFNLNKIEKLVNTSFYNYWSNCCECTIKCPKNIKLNGN